MKSILVIRPDDNLEHDFAPEILKAEGLFHFEVVSQNEVAPSRLKNAAVVLTLRGAIGRRATGILVDYLRSGGRLLSVLPGGDLAARLGVERQVVVSTQKVDPNKAVAAGPPAEDPEGGGGRTGGRPSIRRANGTAGAAVLPAGHRAQRRVRRRGNGRARRRTGQAQRSGHCPEAH